MGAPRDIDETLATTGCDSGVAAVSEADGLASGTRVGRFVVLARVGAGGMGEVYSAYDPELDRRVAIMLLRPDVAGAGAVAEARLRREARTMARIVDRNLVTVHDVGVHERRVWVAMEFVDGATLRGWAEGKRWDAILAAYLEAGRGLAAAHAAGIVHRDFKPDNVLVANDGRVAVTDFGIARTPGSVDPEEPGVIGDVRLTTTGAIIGTPRYMAPEQLEGTLADVRSDQFAFCVSLWEALYGEHPFAAAGAGFPALREAVLRGELRAPPPSKVPPRVRQALARGLARDPARRWPSLAELYAALDVLAPSRRRVWITLAAAGLVAAGSIAYGAWQAEHRVVDAGATCTGSEAFLRGVWDGARAKDVDAAFAATKLPYAVASARLVRGRLDDWSHRWVDARTHACRATRVYRERSEATLDAAMRCFDGQRRAARALVDVFASATRDEVSNAAWALGELPRPERCADPAGLAGQAPPSDPRRAALVEELAGEDATARALIGAGDYASALAVLGPASVSAQLSGYVPTQARIEMDLGQAQMDLGSLDVARAHLERAMELADEAKEDSLRGDAALVLGSNAYYAARYDDARRWLSIAEAIMHRTGAEDDLLGQVLEMRGQVDLEVGDRAQALAELQEAARVFEQGTPSVDLASVYSALASAEEANGEPNLATIDHRKALDAGERFAGPGHPLTAKLLVNFGAFLLKHDRVDDALPLFQRALAIKEAVLGPDDPSLGFAVQNIAVVMRTKGRWAEAEADYTRALALFESSEEDAYAVPSALYGLAIVRLHQDRPAEAVPLLERAIAMRAAAKERPGVSDGENHFQLARALWASGRDKSGARDHAVIARELFRAAGDDAKVRLAEADRWLRDPDRYVPGPNSPF